jgi:hypothetical protein
LRDYRRWRDLSGGMTIRADDGKTWENSAENPFHLSPNFSWISPKFLNLSFLSPSSFSYFLSFFFFSYFPSLLIFP